MKTTLHLAAVFPWLTILCLPLTTAQAQSVSGYVLSANGMAIPGVAVVATKTSTLQHTTNVTDVTGHYSIATAASSTYSVVPGKTGYGFTPASTNLTYSTFGQENYQVNFSTPATVPTAGILGSQPAIIIDPLTATLVGTSNPDGTNTVAYFQFGLTTGYGQFSSSNNIGGGLVSVGISNTITGLIPGTNYHLQLIASNQFGMALSGDHLFTMPAGVPAVTTLAASSVTASSATLNGTVATYTFLTSAWFEWGASNNPYSYQTTPVILTGTNNALAYGTNLTGLTPGVVYHYRAVATNSAGSSNGTDMLFGAPPVVLLLGPATITNECHTFFSDPGATNAAGLPVVVTGSVNTNSPGNYLLIYTATNSLGGAGTATRTVVVADTTGPVITLLGASPLYVPVNTSLIDPGATALDACGGSFAVTSNNTVNLAVPGNYAINYYSTDNYNNLSTTVRPVVVRPRQIVTTTGDGDPGSLRYVLSNSISGDIIQFATNLSGATIYLTNGLITWSNSYNLDGSMLPNGVIINGSQNGGILQIYGGTNVLTGLAFNSGSAGINPANGDGGAISNASMLTLNHCSFTANIRANHSGAAVSNRGTLVVSNCSFIGNFALAGAGGAIANFSTGAVYNATMINNAAGSASGYGGGAIYNAGTLTVNQSTLSGNAVLNYAAGGAVFNDQYAVLTLNQSTLIGNAADGYIDGTHKSAGGDGGAIFNYQGFATVNQCTFFGNHADASYDGGGAVMNDGFSSPGILYVNQSTFVGNHANNTTSHVVSYQNGGGGIWSVARPMFLTNSIIAGNSATNTSGSSYGFDVLGSINATNCWLGGANIIQVLASYYAGPTPINQPPLLATLGSYGGPTQTMPPLPGSPAVDAGSNSMFATDQRGFPRVVGVATDIGAVEGIYNPAGPGALTGMKLLPNGTTTFSFTNYTDTAFSVLATTNLWLPIDLWSTLGAALEFPPGSGHFQFTDLKATNSPQRFYRVSWP